MSAALELNLIDHVEQERRRIAESMGFLTEEQVTNLTKTTCKTVEDWRKRGNGPTHIRFGNAYFYEVTDVLAYMKSLKRERSRESIISRI